MNILFSDTFSDDFACLGNTANRQTLDTGKAANDEGFWKKVTTAFTDNTNYEYGQFKYMVDDVFICEFIDPSKVVKHDWKKLRSMWKAVNAEYKAALIRFTQSGTHNDNFYGYCCGKKDIYYLRLLLNQRPNLNEMVEACLPEVAYYKITDW
jgi:hypothetical protein